MRIHRLAYFTVAFAGLLAMLTIISVIRQPRFETLRDRLNRDIRPGNDMAEIISVLKKQGFQFTIDETNHTHDYWKFGPGKNDILDNYRDLSEETLREAAYVLNTRREVRQATLYPTTEFLNITVLFDAHKKLLQQRIYRTTVSF